MRGALTCSWAVVSLLAACQRGPSVESLCEDLDQDCMGEVDVEECNEDGEQLERHAERGCEDTFDAYLDCVDVNLCAWDTACASRRAELDRCIEDD